MQLHFDELSGKPLRTQTWRKYYILNLIELNTLNVP